MNIARLRTFGLFLLLGLATLLVVLEEDGGNEGLEVHHVLVEVACVLVLPDAPLQVVFSWLTGHEDVNARAVLCVEGTGNKVTHTGFFLIL